MRRLLKIVNELTALDKEYEAEISQRWSLKNKGE